MTSKKEVVKRLNKAFSHIHMVGVKGHSMTGGLVFESIVDRLDYKHLIHSKNALKGLLEGLQSDVKVHDISKATKEGFIFDIKLIDALDYGYRTSFITYLLLARQVYAIGHFLQKKKLPKNDPSAKKLFADDATALHAFLQQQQKQINSLNALANNHTGVALQLADLTTMDNSLINYLSGRGAIKHSFKDEARLEKTLKQKRISDKDQETIKELLKDELENCKKLLKMVNVMLKRAIKFLTEDEAILKRALVEHELPASFVADDTHMHSSIVGLFEKQIHSLHIIHNQVDALQKKILP